MVFYARYHSGSGYVDYHTRTKQDYQLLLLFDKSRYVTAKVIHHNTLQTTPRLNLSCQCHRPTSWLGLTVAKFNVICTHIANQIAYNPTTKTPLSL